MPKQTRRFIPQVNKYYIFSHIHCMYRLNESLHLNLTLTIYRTPKFGQFNMFREQIYKCRRLKMSNL